MVRSWMSKRRSSEGAVSDGRRRSRVRAGGVAAVLTALMSSLVVLGAPGTALASCGTPGSGGTGFVSGGVLYYNTVWTKQPPGCFDFNLTYVNSPGGVDSYRGWYYSGGLWHAGANGYHRLNNGSYNDVALVTNVITGVKLTVESVSYDDTVHVDY